MLKLTIIYETLWSVRNRIFSVQIDMALLLAFETFPRVIGVPSFLVRKVENESFHWSHNLGHSVMFLQRNDKPSTFVCLIAIGSYTCLFFFSFSRYVTISRILKCEKRPVSFTHSSNLYLKSQAQVILKFSCQELSSTGYPTKCLVCVHLKYMFTWSYLTVTLKSTTSTLCCPKTWPFKHQTSRIDLYKTRNGKAEIRLLAIN